MDKKEKQHLSLDNRFIMNIEEFLNNLNFLLDLSLEDNIFKNFKKIFKWQFCNKVPSSQILR